MRVLAVIPLLALFTVTALAQQGADTAAQRRMVDSIARLRLTRDSLVRLADSLEGRAAGRMDTVRHDTTETLIIFKGANASADVSRGVVAGGMRAREQRREQNAAAAATQNQNVANQAQAYGACMKGKGYTVN